jgi:hypothetical protein
MKVEEKEQQEQQKKNAVQNRRATQQQKEANQFRNLYSKYMNQATLTIVVIKAMLQYFKEHGESPIAAQKDDLYK